jgi:hypothetical protein
MAEVIATLAGAIVGSLLVLGIVYIFVNLDHWG